jgi:hypothetical protein
LPLVVPLLLSPGCASRDRGKLPTLQDDSDGTSVTVDALRTQWISGRLSPDLFAAGFRWAGPLPGEGLTPVPARPPLSLAVFRAASDAPPTPTATRTCGFSAPVFASRLESIGRTLVSLGREATISTSAGAEARLLLGLFLSGRGAGGGYQEGGKVRGPRSGGKRGGWSPATEGWLSASATAPLYENRRLRRPERPHRAPFLRAAKNVRIWRDTAARRRVLDFDGDGRPDSSYPAATATGSTGTRATGPSRTSRRRRASRGSRERRSARWRSTTTTMAGPTST